MKTIIYLAALLCLRSAKALSSLSDQLIKLLPIVTRQTWLWSKNGWMKVPEECSSGNQVNHPYLPGLYPESNK